MEKVLKKLNLLLIAGSLFWFVGCENPEQKEPITPQKAIAALTEFAQVSNQFSATVKESGSRVDGTGLNVTSNILSAIVYPQVSCTLLGDDTWKVVCNYGPTLIQCDDGYLRRGIVNIVTNGFFIAPGTVMTLTFDNFYQKGDWLQQEYKIDGTQVIKNEGINAKNSNMIDYSVTVTNGLITYNTKEIHYSETTTRTLLPSSTLCENNWYITGEWSGVSSDKVSYTLKASQTPLHYKVCCHFFQDGILNVDVEGLSPFSIDYGYAEGEEDCDRKAELNYPGLKSIFFDM